MRKYLSLIFMVSFFMFTSNFSIVGNTVYRLPEVAKPTRIAVDHNRVYIVDGASILIYSLPDFNFLKKFGRDGEGPGELKGIIYYIEIHSDNILVYSNGRLSWFTFDGEFIKQKTETQISVNYKTLGQDYVGMKLVREKDGIFFAICLFNSELKILKELHRYRHPFFKLNKPKVNAADARVSSYCIFEQKIYIDKADGSIWVFDKSGNKLNVLIPKLNKVRVTSGHKERWLEFWRTNLKAEYEAFQHRLQFPPYFPLIRDFLVTGRKIYLLTYVEKEGKNEMQILDLKGKLLERAWVPLKNVNPLLPHLISLYTINNNKLYILQDNEDTETWEICLVGLDSGI